MKKIFLILIYSFFILSNTSQAHEIDKSSKLFITGSSQYEILPDVGEVTLGVEFQDTSAGVAQKSTNAKVSSFIGQLKDIGIKDKEIKTVQNSLSSIRDYKSKVDPNKIIGYKSIQRIRVRIKGRDRLNLLSKIIDLTTNHSINSINSIQFSASPKLQKEAKNKAISLAALDAKKQSEELLKTLGLNLKRIKEIRINQHNFHVSNLATNLSRSTNGYMEDADETISNVMSGELLVNGQVEMVIEFE